MVVGEGSGKGRKFLKGEGEDMTRVEVYQLIEQLEEATVAKAYAEDRYSQLKSRVMDELMRHYPLEPRKGEGES